MEAPAQLGVYFAVLRKHLLLLGVSAALVLAAGAFYIVRQQPVFVSSATLVVENPTRNVASGGGYADLLALMQDELQMQVFLIKQNKEIARQAIDKLKSDGIDVVVGDYTETTLPAALKVEFIPGMTHAVSFSLTGPDRASLPAAVNSYAQAFQKWSERKSATAFDLQEKQFAAEVEAAERKLKALHDAQADLAVAHRDVNLAAEENDNADSLRSLKENLPTIAADIEYLAAQRAATLAALEKAGVEARKSGDGYEILAKDVAADRAAAELESRLADDPHVLALKAVNDNKVVLQWLSAAANAEERDRRLKEAGRTDGHESRVAAKADIEKARSRLGRSIAAAIEAELVAIDGDQLRKEKQRGQFAGLRADAETTGGLKAEYRRLRDAIDAQKRVVDRASAELKKFQDTYVSSSDSTAKDNKATRRIVIATPAESAAQIAPKVPLIIGLTVFAALAVGLGLVLLFEYLDDTIKSREDFDRYVGLPFLGFIPRIEAKDGVNPDLAADGRSGTAVGEAFRAVRTSILFSRSDKPVRTILVTSAGPGEGKTTVATNLAITLSQHKGPVLLIDADLRRPRVAKALGIENKTGLTNYLIGEATLDEVVQKTSVEGLFAITSGPIPPNPAELLHGEKLAFLLKTGLERFDRIVIDSPPVIAVSDARVIARCADGLYLVISMGKTSWRLIQRSLESLTSIGFSVHGAILNNLSVPTGRYGYYYYRDYQYGKSYYTQQKPAAEN